MEDSRHHEADSNADAGQQSIGSALRAGRVARQLSSQDIANQLHLDASAIEAVESDSYDGLGAVAFVRGYIRNYARLIELDPEPLLLQFDKHAPQAPEVQPYSSRPASQARSGDRPVKAMTYSVVAVLSALLAIWWHTQYGEAVVIDTGVPGEEAVEEEPNTSGYNLDYTYPIVVHPDTLVPTRRGVEPVSISPPAPKPPPPPSATLSLTLSDEAWIEIYDAQGERLYYDLGKPAEHIKVNGRRPYRVKIGRASAATVEYQGAVLDIKPFSQRGIARFQVGDEGITEQ